MSRDIFGQYVVRLAMVLHFSVPRWPSWISWRMYDCRQCNELAVSEQQAIELVHLVRKLLVVLHAVGWIIVRLEPITLHSINCESSGSCAVSSRSYSIFLMFAG